MTSFRMITDARKSATTTNEETETGFTAEMLPKSLSRVILHCEQFSCVAKIDAKGVWRNAVTNKPISGKIVDWEPV